MNTEPIRKWWTVHRNDVGRELADPGWAEWAGKRVAELEAENAKLREALEAHRLLLQKETKERDHYKELHERPMRMRLQN